MDIQDAKDPPLEVSHFAGYGVFEMDRCLCGFVCKGAENGGSTQIVESIPRRTK